MPALVIVIGKDNIAQRDHALGTEGLVGTYGNPQHCRLVKGLLVHRVHQQARGGTTHVTGLHLVTLCRTCLHKAQALRQVQVTLQGTVGRRPVNSNVDGALLSGMQIHVVEVQLVIGVDDSRSMAGRSQDDILYLIDVGNTDFSILVDIGSQHRHVVKFSAQDDVDQRIDIGDIHLTIVVDIATQPCQFIEEVAPLACHLIQFLGLGRHSQRNRFLIHACPHVSTQSRHLNGIAGQ